MTPGVRAPRKRRARRTDFEPGTRVEHTATGWLGTVTHAPTDRLGVPTCSVSWHSAPVAPRPLRPAPGRLGRISTAELTIMQAAPEIVE